jgi:hypothetical protein
MNPPVILGIDPGIKGAIAVVRRDAISVYDMPTVDEEVAGKMRKRIDAHTFRDIIIGVGPVQMVLLEKPTTRPGEAPRAALSYGIGFGQMLGILVALERPHKVILSQAWTKALGVGADKDDHRVEAMRRFPASSDLFKRKKDDGRADAALIALYGWMS